MKKTIGLPEAEFAARHDPKHKLRPIEEVLPLKFKPGTQRFILTAAQNATPVHEKFWLALLQAKKHYKAALGVQKLRYKNPTSVWSASQRNAEWWDEPVRDYLVTERAMLNRNVAYLGDIKIQPTAKDPLSDLTAYTGAESCIVGHTKLQFRTIAAPGHKLPKMMTTTGACTERNYTDSRVGKHGDFHHILGAVIVEVEGPFFWLRHLNAHDDGSFIDLDKRFTPYGVEDAPRPEGIVLGDTHAEFTDPDVDRGTFGESGIVTTLRPRRIFWHDLHDGYACNPHHRGKPFIAAAKAKSGKDDVGGEVHRSAKFAIDRTPEDAESYIICSNHDDFLARWIDTADWKTEGRNGGFYLETAKFMWDQTRMGESGSEVPSPFAYWVSTYGAKNVHCLTKGESYVVEGIETGMHGHIGTNGARGSLQNLSRVATKFVIGHGHGPGIRNGGYQVGTNSRLKQEYNDPMLSNWLHTDCLIHKGGKRQLVTFIDGRWRL